METFWRLGTIELVSTKENSGKANNTIQRLKLMVILRLVRICFLGALFMTGFFAADVASAQTTAEDQQFGPVVRAYLGYLRNEQGVVDDRVSRREVNVAYYRRNSNRIRALRQMALRIAGATQNDYLPELEAVAGDEMGLLFERPPRSGTLRIGEVLQSTFRYLGVVRTGEMFYVFARLDPYEQSQLIEQNNHNTENAANPGAADSVSGARSLTRARRVNAP
jgi:hypothetical protein